MGFWFAQLLLHDRALKTRNPSSRPTLCSEIVRLSTSIMKLARQFSGPQTPYLTDHIFHMISFASVTLCRLLHTHEDQLSLSQHDVQRLDDDILSTAMWLHAIALSCHVAHTMGDVVLAFHRRLRPRFENVLSNQMADGIDPAVQDDFAVLFPEFYGEVAVFDVGGDANMLPLFEHDMYPQ